MSVDIEKRIRWWVAAAAYLATFVVADFANFPHAVYAPIERVWAFGQKVPGAVVSMHLFGYLAWGVVGGIAGYLVATLGLRARSGGESLQKIETALAIFVFALFVLATIFYTVENIHAVPVPIALPAAPPAG